MYYEVKEISKYPRKNKKTGHITEIVQLNLKTNSKFEKGQTVAVVDLETLENELNNNNSDELEKLRKENEELHKKLKDVPELSEVQRLHHLETQKLNVKIQSQNDLINALCIAYTDLRKRGLIGRVRNKPPENYQVIDEHIKQLEGVIINNTQQNK